MASDLQNKSIQTEGVETHSFAQQNPNEILAASESFPFTPDQQQILGNVHQLILGWRRECLMKATQHTEREA
ncbi:MAG TPA: hypothetical protein VLA72_18525 [Anaerolineales bacterium]|jgi:hypothetical protein|nr:hypothetical protein [Anaerolineales bacterium]